MDSLEQAIQSINGEQKSVPAEAFYNSKIRNNDSVIEDHNEEDEEDIDEASH
jgi:hypothetical protein